jgi:cytochrome P450
MRPPAVRARGRDRRVYTAGHPVLLGLLTATRRLPVVRVGRTVLVHGTDAFRDVLLHVPLDRLAPGTTGGAARALDAADVLFDQSGVDHRAARRALAADLGSAGVHRLRPTWTPLLDAAASAVGAGERVDVVALARRLAGTTAAAPARRRRRPDALADVALAAAAAAVGSHLPSARAGTDPRVALDGSSRSSARPRHDGRLATVSTTVAAVPRASPGQPMRGCGLPPPTRSCAPPWSPSCCASWPPAPSCRVRRPRTRTSADRRVRRGDRLVLVARSAARSVVDPDPTAPQPAAVQSLVFGAGPHACPGAALARAQLADVLAAFAPYAPHVVRAEPDRTAALPAWAVLEVAR